ncbi:MAG: cation:dicarboxylase symporter family transporter, partial [Anaerovibrio sp.]|nr:cation:dicarboxylase symporter family transporter [Anaerovibrio sp.]
MSLQTCSISNKNYRETIEWLEERLTEMGATKKEILTGTLLLEEAFFRLEKASAVPDNFAGKITIRKRFGDISISVSARGEAFNPFVSMEEVSEDEEEMYVFALLKAHKDSLSYNRSNGDNIISIRVHSSSSKKAFQIIAGLVTGLILGVVLKYFLNEAGIRWVESIILTPIQSMFIQALMMLAGPLIFFSIMSGITGMSNAADIGKMGGKLLGVSVMKLALVLLIGTALGIWVGAIPEMAEFIQQGKEENVKAITMMELIVGIVPKNVVVPFASNNMLQILFIALFFGILLAKAGDRAARAKEVVEFCNRFTMDAMGVLMPIMPFVVAVSMTKMMLHTDFSMLLAYGQIILTGYL